MSNSKTYSRNLIIHIPVYTTDYQVGVFGFSICTLDKITLFSFDFPNVLKYFSKRHFIHHTQWVATWSSLLGVFGSPLPYSKLIIQEPRMIPKQPQKGREVLLMCKTISLACSSKVFNLENEKEGDPFWPPYLWTKHPK